MAKDKPYQFSVEIPKGYSPDVREAIASEIISFVRQRTLKGQDFEGAKFPGYSKAYSNSVNFRAAGKAKGKVNLMLSGDMLANIEAVKIKPTELIIGYADNSDQAGKAEGNQIGSYGKEPNSKRARRFLGLAQDDLLKILKKYPIDNEVKSEARAQAVNEAQVKIDEYANEVDANPDDISPEELAKNFKIKVGK